MIFLRFSPDGNSTLMLAAPALSAINSAPSTDAIWSGFHTANAYCLPEIPEICRVNWSRPGVHDSDTTLKPWLDSPSGGNSWAILTPKSFRTRIRNLLRPVEAGTDTVTC